MIKRAILVGLSIIELCLVMFSIFNSRYLYISFLRVLHITQPYIFWISPTCFFIVEHVINWSRIMFSFLLVNHPESDWFFNLSEFPDHLLYQTWDHQLHNKTSQCSPPLHHTPGRSWQNSCCYPEIINKYVVHLSSRFITVMSFCFFMILILQGRFPMIQGSDNTGSFMLEKFGTVNLNDHSSGYTYQEIINSHTR